MDYLEKRSALLARRMDEVANKATRRQARGGAVSNASGGAHHGPDGRRRSLDGFSEAFTHLHTGLPADERRIVMTAVARRCHQPGADTHGRCLFGRVLPPTRPGRQDGTFAKRPTGVRSRVSWMGSRRSPWRGCSARVFRRARTDSISMSAVPVKRSARSTATTAANRRSASTPTLPTDMRPSTPPFSTGSAGEAGARHWTVCSITKRSRPGCSSYRWWRRFRSCVRPRAHIGLPVRAAYSQHRRPETARDGQTRTLVGASSLIGGRIDEELIEAHWDDVLRLAASVRTGTVSASLMLKRLGAYPRQNGLALALREIGRIERTLFTLDWLEDPQLRRESTVELNKGESRNALARAVCFHRLGRIRDRSREGQQHRASGLALLTAAIVLWNTVYLDRALTAMTKAGRKIDEALLPHIAPLGWQHINLTGDYLWSETPPLDDDGYRQLRRFNVLESMAA
ncbi:Tn3 family transposase (plasmid) [Mesorhizobium sp. NBSH29]|nr:Tn3 family transposase [Mesorhizobium sp. NBSH29]